jgi:hypothetical protein
MRYKGDFEMNPRIFSRTFEKGYQPIDKSGGAESAKRPSPEKAGGALRWLLGDAAEKKNKAIKEASNMINDANSAKSFAHRLDTPRASISDQNIDDLISQTDRVEHWIEDNKTPLGWSRGAYAEISKCYNDARNAWQEHTGTRTTSSGIASRMAMAVVSLGGYLSAKTIEISSDEIKEMKRVVAREAYVFLHIGVRDIQKLADSFPDTHALKDQ